jgi:hypothetical protein
MTNTTVTEKYVVKTYSNDEKTGPFTTTEFAFIEDAERVFNFNSKAISVFKRKVVIEEEEIPTEDIE